MTGEEHEEEPAEEPQVPFADLVGGFTTAPMVEGDVVTSVFAVVKAKSSAGEVVWAGRSGGEPLSSEELLGVLSSLAASIQRDLAEDWEW
jgi:hypothetical protein